MSLNCTRRGVALGGGEGEVEALDQGRVMYATLMACGEGLGHEGRRCVQGEREGARRTASGGRSRSEGEPSDGSGYGDGGGVLSCGSGSVVGVMGNTKQVNPRRI